MRAETALRLAGERLLLSGGDRWYSGGGLGDVATALVLLCDVAQEVAEQVVADYGLARSLRLRGWPPHLRPGRRHVARAQQPSRPTPTPTPPTVVPCDTTVDLPDGVFKRRDRKAIKRLFDEMHELRYGTSAPQENAEIVSLRATVTGLMRKPKPAKIRRGVSSSGALMRRAAARRRSRRGTTSP